MTNKSRGKQPLTQHSPPLPFRHFVLSSLTGNRSTYTRHLDVSEKTKLGSSMRVARSCGSMSISGDSHDKPTSSVPRGTSGMLSSSCLLPMFRCTEGGRGERGRDLRLANTTLAAAASLGVTVAAMDVSFASKINPEVP